MPQIISYPRLYRIEVTGEGSPVTSRGDQTVTELFRYSSAGGGNLNLMTFRLQVLDCAVRLFGDFRAWMILQRNNPTLSGYNLEFLRDTMSFILKGERKFPPLVWGDLMDEQSTYAQFQHHQTYPDLAIPEDITTEQVIQLWCARRNGFEDLLQTLYVLFGNERGPNT